MEAALFGFLFPSVGGFGRALHCAALLAGFWIVLLMIASIAWLLPFNCFLVAANRRRRCCRQQNFFLIVCCWRLFEYSYYLRALILFCH